MKAMLAMIALLAVPSLSAQAGSKPEFAVASVKQSRQQLGRDARGEFVWSRTGVTARNVSLQDLVVQAYGVQPHQIAGGPNWLDVNEYDLDARSQNPASKEELRRMLQTLLADRFGLALHREAKEMRVYALIQDKRGAKIQPVKQGAKPSGGFFRGEMTQFATLLSIQLTIHTPSDPSRPGMAGGAPVPVVDHTGLMGIYEIDSMPKPELGSDMFTLWQRMLQDELGLKLETRQERVELLVIETAAKTPIAN
jgi:uncharacterized protein (TIGR03435 family)